MSSCPSCGAPISIGGAYPFTAQYTCFCRFNRSPAVGNITFAPPSDAERDGGCKPLVHLTEQRVREIVREELARIEACKPSSDNP